MNRLEQSIDTDDTKAVTRDGSLSTGRHHQRVVSIDHGMTWLMACFHKSRRCVSMLLSGQASCYKDSLGNVSSWMRKAIE